MSPFTTVQDAGRELARRLHQQELTAAFARFTLGAGPLQTVLDEVCRVSCDGMRCSFADVLEFLPTGNEFIMRAGIGWQPGSVGQARLGADLASPAGYAFQTGQPVLSDRLADETRFRTPRLLVDHGIRRAFCVPVSTPDWRFGILEVDSPDERDFTLSDTAFLETLAAILAQAVARQQRHDEQRASRTFAQGVLEASPDCVMVLSREGIVRFMNRKGLETNGLESFDQVYGTDYVASWPVKSQGAIRQAIRQAVTGQASQFEGACPTADGQPRWLELNLLPVQDSPGEAPQIVCISRDISERRFAEQALRDSEDRLQLAIHAADLGTWDLDLVHDTSVRSPEHDRMFGYDEVQVSWGKQTAERHVLEEDKPIYREGFVRAAETGFLAFEVRVRGQDGALRWIAPQGRVHYDEAGAPVRIVGVIADITERKRAESALSRLNADLEQQVMDRTLERGRTWQVSPDLLSVLDLETGIFEHVNPAWTATFGVPIDEIEGKRFADLVHPDDLDASKAAFDTTRTGTPVLHFENRYPHRDGSHRILSWVAVPANGKLYSRARDVTEEKAQAEALRLTQTRAATYFNSSDNYLFLVQVDGHGTVRFEDINPACERAMGVRRADIFGHGVDSFMPQDSAQDVIRFARLCLETRDPQTYQARRTYRDGRSVLIEGHVTLVERLADGSGLILFSGRDVTGQRATEEALRQSQKMEAVGQLTGGLAHDFNNLLTGVTGSLELMQTRIAQGRVHDVERFVLAAQGAAKRAAALTHRLLAFSRRQTLDPKPTDLNGLVTGIIELIQRTVGPAITVESAAAGGLWPTLVDPGQLENTLLNLCINARDAMPDGGKITVETGNRWLDERTARDRDLPPGQYVSLCVSDTGTGMSPDVIAKAFDPFFTTKPIGQGTGLGLSMIYGFTRQSGGQVRIYSEIGQGTMVCIYLPRFLGAADMDELTPGPADTSRAEDGETVLVVDDEPTVRMLVVEVLEDLGYRAIEAADGPAGLQILHSDTRIDLLVTDVGLPGGMNGRQMADAARVARPELKVLFITGFAENAVVSHGHLDPGMHILTKPFAMEALAGRIKDLITDGKAAT